MFNPTASEAMARDRMRAREADAARHSSEIASALALAAPFSSCSKRELRLVAKVAKTRVVGKGTTLMVEGDSGESMLVLLAGGADVHKGGRRVAQIGTGDVVGELAALTKCPRNATVTMRTDGEIAVIGRRDLLRLVKGSPSFSQKLLEALAQRVRELDRKLVP
jgi:CRP/FNR family transcriptional regulator, cyclic AMP receptor protein